VTVRGFSRLLTGFALALSLALPGRSLARGQPAPTLASSPSQPSDDALHADSLAARLGRVVALSLGVLFAGFSLGHLALGRARRRRGAKPALDSSVKRSDNVIKIFLKHAPVQVESLGRALDAGDVATLRAAAHKLRGSCLAVGIPRMAELCGGLEAGSADGGVQYAELRRVFGDAQRELAAEMAERAAGPSS
jgi:HPt (histidine-containing phosphotransfer) domain-containing protein